MSKFAAIQMGSGSQVSANLLAAEKLIAEAVRDGAEFVVLPENFALMGKTEQDKLEIREKEGAGRLQTFLSEQARKHGVWLHGGTIPLASDDPGKVYATSLLFDANGRQVARYDKIHLFDVHVVGSDERYTESETIIRGDQVVVADTPFGRVGMAVCYDLRFPELFRQMLDQGAEIILLPAAFTDITGRAHWEILLRARAIENLCYIVAAAQGGYHVNGRATYGHTMIVDPWGGIVAARNSTSCGVVVGDIKTEYLQTTRKQFPALEHRRLPAS
ncbi:MAG TPA: carbon-nitrogen hydrolase family protein [Gammaproteobacteria bacterium]|nr:carbon-nitrogen hydrolase family protein [Gammaproteobacteria bacterium]